MQHADSQYFFRHISIAPYRFVVLVTVVPLGLFGVSWTWGTLPVLKNSSHTWTMAGTA
jgi:hypothetical protein